VPTNEILDTLTQQGGRIALLVLDGLGGLPREEDGRTELEAARTPHLDDLARRSSCGLLEMVGPGITPGSGPGHLALFGYDPVEHLIGRGVLSALGIDFAIEEGDVAVRINFATLDEDGRVTDRRAGRLPTERNRELCQRLRKSIELDLDGRYFLETVSEHRAVLVLRGKGLGGQVGDTDPQRTGVPPLEAKATAEGSERTAALVRSFVEQARQVLADEGAEANGLLLRGFESYRPMPSLGERFGLKAACVADYPMYRGLSRLLGFDVLPPPGGIEACLGTLASIDDGDHDFFFLHVKDTDKAGEDGDFDAKVAAIEAVDRALPALVEAEPDVLAVTGDHSTPSAMAAHSWHPVPLLLHARLARRDHLGGFGESECGRGSLGLRPARDLMGLLLAHAGRLKKYGA
jgi:2,3-bisphosphoglycerate-independent phosphoglycerate mutase